MPTFGQQNGWASAATLASIGVAVVGLIVLFLVEKKASNPILNGKFMARKNFVLPVLVMLLTQGLMTACLTEIIRFGYAIDKATVAAVAMSIEYLGMAIGTVVLGPMADKKEPKVVAAIALVFVAIGSLIMLFIGEDDAKNRDGRRTVLCRSRHRRQRHHLHAVTLSVLSLSPPPLPARTTCSVI